MNAIQRLNSYRVNFLNLKRLNGLSVTRKAYYLANVLTGETLRTRTVGAFGLRLVEISLTDRCQCHCVHCYTRAKNACSECDELSTKEVIHLLDDILSMGATEVCFTGGEPLLRKDIIRLVHHAHQNGLVTRIISNGILMNEEFVIRSKRAGLNWCSISIDSVSPRLHDRLRGFEGCFEKAVNSLRLLVKYRVPCSIVTIARKDAIYSGELEKIVAFGQDLGVTVVRINFPVPIGRLRNRQEEVLNRGERDKVRELLRYGTVCMESPRESIKCTAGVTKINILSNGDVQPCVFIPLSYGNIRQKKISEIWKAMDKNRKEYVVKGQCPMCDPLIRNKLQNAAKRKIDA